MPITRPITPEEDITMSLSTIITGIMSKYQDKLGAKAVMLSMFGNTLIGLNGIVEGMPITFTEKTQLREDMKLLAKRALRSPLTSVSNNEE